jgi:hypothetical protein
MGVDFEYCSTCCECLVNYDFDSCEYCGGLMENPKINCDCGYMCKFCVGGLYKYNHEGEEINLCHRCNPKYLKGEENKEQLEKVLKYLEEEY